MISRVDPDLYYTPYEHQMRRFSVRIAEGDPGGLTETFTTPEYYQKPRMSHFIGTRFEVGLNVKDPVSNQEGITFYSLFESPPNRQAAFARNLAEQAAIPQHTNLESPTGQSLKQTLNLPYKTHSQVDPQKSANFWETLQEAYGRFRPADFRRRVLSILDVEMGKLFEDLGTYQPFFQGLDWLDSQRRNLVSHVPITPRTQRTLTALRNRVLPYWEAFHDVDFGSPVPPRNVSLRSIESFFDRLEDRYPILIGVPRNVVREYYTLTEHALYHGIQSENRIFAVASRAFLYSEAASRDLNLLYLIDPSRMVGRLIRSAAGVANYNFRGIALEGLERGTLDRQIIKIGGTAFALLHVAHSYHKWFEEKKEAWERVRENGSVDPFESGREQVDRERRREALKAWRQGKTYDPTRIPTHDRGGVFAGILGEIRELSPNHLYHKAKDIAKHPKDNIDLFVGAAAYLSYAVPVIVKHARSSEEEGLFARILSAVGRFKGDPQASFAAGILGSIGLAAPGFLTSHTWAGRLGGLGFLASALISSKLGGEAGVLLMKNSAGARRLAAEGHRFLAKLNSFLETPYFDQKAAHYLEEARLIESEGESEALMNLARLLGQEVIGELAEVPVALFLGAQFRRLGEYFDSRGRRRSRDRNKDQGPEHTGREYFSVQAARKAHVENLVPFLTKAYSYTDIATNPDYSRTQRAILTLMKQTGFGDRILKTASPKITQFRRAKAIHKAVKMKVRSHTHSQDLTPDYDRLRKAYDRYQEYGNEGDTLNQYG